MLIKPDVLLINLPDEVEAVRKAWVPDSRGKPVLAAKRRKACSCLNFMHRAPGLQLLSKVYNRWYGLNFKILKFYNRLCRINLYVICIYRYTGAALLISTRPICAFLNCSWIQVCSMSFIILGLVGQLRYILFMAVAEAQDHQQKHKNS